MGDLRLNRRKRQSPNRVIRVAFHVNGVKLSFVIAEAWLSYNIKHRGYLWTDKNLMPNWTYGQKSGTFVHLIP